MIPLIIAAVGGYLIGSDDKALFSDGGSVERKYKLGDKWRYDFDYAGMLRAALKANISWGAKKLERLSNSFESVNYHTSNRPLWSAIKLIEAGDTEAAKQKLDEFHKIVEQSLKEELNQQ